MSFIRPNEPPDWRFAAALCRLADDNWSALTAKDIQDIALAACEHGCPSQALNDILVATDPRREELLPLLERVLEEVGIDEPARKDAVAIYALGCLDRVSRGEMPPFETILGLWDVIRLSDDPRLEPIRSLIDWMELELARSDRGRHEYYY